jgi:two-component system osmolarity sensor histidine kinase EnvZ
MRSILYPFYYIKKLLPKTLFGRTLIIVIAPVVFVQMITTYIFIDRHLEKVTELLSKSVALRTTEAVNVALKTSHFKDHFQLLRNHIFTHFELSLEIDENNDPQPSMKKSLLAPYGEILTQALEKKLQFPFHINLKDEDIFISVQTLRGNLILKEKLKHLAPKTTSILLWWAVATPLLFLAIAILFMRNQIKPLRRLAEAVDDFGKGRESIDFKPAGSFEVRKLTYAFISMKERIQRQITQRTEMLAGVSHDLRTPLTRMELQLAMLENSHSIRDLQQDVREMNKMIEDYLAFAKGEEDGPYEETRILLLLQNVVALFPGKPISFTSLEDVYITAHALSLKRAFTNIIENALKYAHSLWITTQLTSEEIKIYFEDDGPGIPTSKREAVFRPFYRLEGSRNSETGGSGLGLAITRDIVLRHGGAIDLKESTQGGLLVMISLPL